MATKAPPDPTQTSSSAHKKKNNSKKKKSAKTKSNGDALKVQDTENLIENMEGDVEDDSDGVKTPRENNPPELTKLQTNGHKNESPTNGHAIEPSQQTSKNQTVLQVSEKADDRDVSDDRDTSSRFEVMSQEREALRAEVEKLRKSLEDIQGKHSGEITTIKNQHAEELAKVIENHTEEVSMIKEEHTEEASTIQTSLEDAESRAERSQTQYNNLMGRINTIKEGLGARMEASRQELVEAKEQIEDLESQKHELQDRVKSLEVDLKRSGEESNESSKELSSLRNRHNLSQQNWVHEREDLIQQTAHLKDEADAAKEAMGDWEVLAMEERSMREGLTERIADIEEQFKAQKEAYEAAVAERDNQIQTVEGLQRALQEVQDTRKRELREMVESYEEQLQTLKKLVQESDTRASEAEASKGAFQTELERLGPFEKEVKEKNLQIGKLRHEAIVLNDHLTKALRFLKKAKPEDNVDRQIVTNHFLHFLALDRSDPKKFQILQLIASLLNWTDEQKEQAGLARPGASNSSLRLPMSPFHRTPSTPSLSSEFFAEAPSNKESLADLWTGFLERSAEEGSTKGSRSGSVSSTATTLRPETRSADNSSSRG